MRLELEISYPDVSMYQIPGLAVVEVNGGGTDLSVGVAEGLKECRVASGCNTCGREWVTVFTASNLIEE